MTYIDLYQSGRLRERVRAAYGRLRNCDLCPRDCGIDRISGETGFCEAGLKPRIASANIHRGEEPPISGTRGSGTIFFSYCTLRCRFCQNFPISQMGNGEEITTGQLASRMLKLQKQGVHNINFVTPCHYLPQILAALLQAIPRGFRLPIVWNTSGYEKVDALQLLDGIVDIYLPDMKYDDPRAAAFCSGRKDYVKANRRALLEMWRQVGPLRLDSEGRALRGMLVRHLVLPGDLSGTRNCLRFLADRLGAGVWVSLMGQYFPAHRAPGMPPLDRKVTREEYEKAKACLEEFGLVQGFVQGGTEEEAGTFLPRDPAPRKRGGKREMPG